MVSSTHSVPEREFVASLFMASLTCVLQIIPLLQIVSHGLLQVMVGMGDSIRFRQASHEPIKWTRLGVAVRSALGYVYTTDRANWSLCH